MVWLKQTKTINACINPPTFNNYGIFILNSGPHFSEAPPSGVETCSFRLQETDKAGAVPYSPGTIPLADCERRCSDTFWCTSFSFTDETSKCRLHNNLETVDEPGSVYYVENCTTISGKFEGEGD